MPPPAYTKLTIKMFTRLVTPPDIHVSGLMFYHGFFHISSFFYRQLPAELAERNSTIFGHMIESKCNLKMHVRNLGYPIPLQIGGPKPPFSTTLQLNSNFNGMKHDIHKQASALQTTVDLLHKCQNDMNFGPQKASNWR